MKENNYRVSNLLRLAGRLKRYAVRMAATILSGILNHLSTIGVAVVCAYLVGLALDGAGIDRIIPLFYILGGVVVLRVIFYFAEMWLAHDIAFKVLRDLRILLLDAVEKVSPGILLNMRTGQLASTLMGDVEVLEWFFAHTFGSTVVAVAVPALLLTFLGFVHPTLPLVMLFFVVLLVLVPMVMKKQADRQGKRVRAELGDANAVTVEGVQGLREILMLGQKEAYREKNRRYMQKMYDSQLRYGKRLGAEGAMLLIIAGLAMLGVMGVAAALVLTGRMAFALYPMVVTLAGMALNPVVEICGTARNFGIIFAAANRVFLVLEAKPQVEDNGPDMDIHALSSEIHFEDVTFRYREDLPPALEGVSFTVAPGETVALVGPSGAGKSTCANLLLRYWDVEAGGVSIGGVDLRKMSMDNLRDLTSAVLQDVFLFHGTLRDNIRLGRKDAGDREVEEAARAALIHDFIVSLPGGYDTQAGERGLRLSGGQRQRIAIARAILKGSPILILDEAVSSLDADNEAEIQKALEQSAQGRTTLVVAHRLSTILSADRIVVLKDGKVAQTGTHEELIGAPGFYRELVGPQLEKAEDGLEPAI